MKGCVRNAFSDHRKQRAHEGKEREGDRLKKYTRENIRGIDRDRSQETKADHRKGTRRGSRKRKRKRVSENGKEEDWSGGPDTGNRGR